MAKKSKFATVILSALPGLGHLYLGWQQRGLQFMLAFFVMLFMLNWMSLSLFGFLLPVLWFYSLFDALQCYDEEPPPPGYRSDAWNWLFEKQRGVGIGLIVVGGLILLTKLAFPILAQYLQYETLRTIGVALVALLLIAGGIRLAWGKPIAPPESQKEITHQPGQPSPEEKITASGEPLPAEEIFTTELPQEEE